MKTRPPEAQFHRLVKGATIRGFPVSALRSEARKGNLELVLVGNRYYVSDEAIDAMLKRCAVLKQPAPKPRTGETLSELSLAARRGAALAYVQHVLKKKGRS